MNNLLIILKISHTLEHVPFGDGTLEAALKGFYIFMFDLYLNICIEWHRVLKPDGMLLIAVPDMNIMAK